jgi:hypothetical protein
MISGLTASAQIVFGRTLSICESLSVKDDHASSTHELEDLFWAEAGKYNALPLRNSKIERADCQPSSLHVRIFSA